MPIASLTFLRAFPKRYENKEKKKNERTNVTSTNILSIKKQLYFSRKSHIYLFIYYIVAFAWITRLRGLILPSHRSIRLNFIYLLIRLLLLQSRFGSRDRSERAAEDAQAKVSNSYYTYISRIVIRLCGAEPNSIGFFGEYQSWLCLFVRFRVAYIWRVVVEIVSIYEP